MEKSYELPVKLARPAQRALVNAGIKTLKQLSKFSEEEIMKLHGMGPDAMQKIKQSLDDNGLSFAKKEK